MAERNSKSPERQNRETRIQQLKHKAEELTGGETLAFESGNCPPEIEGAFWEHVVAFEQAKWISPFEMLVNGGLSLPPPAELDDAQLTAKLWEVIQGLALLGAYLHNTDHLSDRELYEHLWNDFLREPAVLQPDNPDFAYHFDVIGSGSEEDTFIYLKYYADEEERRQWAKEWPEDALPEHEQPPFDRDRHLPTPDRLGLANRGEAS
ncbi:MAG TPA: hypothetical protein VGX03_17070 [Candidatus Binatia bacterium]|jgi:hypothetical protein|nr:hypothetical protein [Candidatus Binatia bacterium]